jgi:hypothetical protein
MEENWQLIFSTNQLYQAEMVKSILEESNIEVILLNKQDSLYLIGDIDLLVHPDQVIPALNKIKKWKNE